MSEEKKFRDRCGFVGVVGSVVSLSGYPYFGATHYVVDISQDGLFVKQCYRGRKVKFVSFVERDIHIANR